MRLLITLLAIVALFCPLRGLAQTRCAIMARLPDVTAAAQNPTYCRVSLTLRPVPDSEIKSEVWLPLPSIWNGKFLMEGGSGLVGAINTQGMMRAIDERCASASTDTGHSGDDGRFALGHPDKITDFAYRAVHQTAVAAKRLIAAYYGRGSRFSYWEGCSTGGRQGLMSAQRYPKDFDSIIAGAPAYNQIYISAWRMRLMMTALTSPKHALPPEKLKMLNEAILNQCDAEDGLKDGLLEDPLSRKFDPNVLRCKGADTTGCLTSQQLETAGAAYTDLRNPSGALLSSRLPFGGELNWRLPGGRANPGMIDVGIFRYLANQNSAWNWHRFNIEADIRRAMEHGNAIEADSPNLTQLKAHGGKLLMYHGWSDGGSGGSISPLNTIAYYDAVLKYMGPKQGDWFPSIHDPRDGPLRRRGRPQSVRYAHCARSLARTRPSSRIHRRY